MVFGAGGGRSRRCRPCDWFGRKHWTWGQEGIGRVSWVEDEQGLDTSDVFWAAIAVALTESGSDM